MERNLSDAQKARAEQKSKLEELVRQKNKRKGIYRDDETESRGGLGGEDDNSQKNRRLSQVDGKDKPARHLPFDKTFGNFFGPSTIIVSEDYKRKQRELREAARNPPPPVVKRATPRTSNSKVSQTSKKGVTPGMKRYVAPTFQTKVEKEKDRDFSDIFGEGFGTSDAKPDPEKLLKPISLPESQPKPKPKSEPKTPVKPLPKPQPRPQLPTNSRMPAGSSQKRPISAPDPISRPPSKQEAPKRNLNGPVRQSQPLNSSTRPPVDQRKLIAPPRTISAPQRPQTSRGNLQNRPNPQRPKVPQRRREEEYSDDSFVDDEEDDRVDLSSVLSMFRRSHRENHRNDREEDFDDRDMEAGWDDVRKEEQRSARIARLEDEREQRLEEERERRLMEKRKRMKG